MSLYLIFLRMCKFKNNSCLLSFFLAKFFPKFKFLISAFQNKNECFLKRTERNGFSLNIMVNLYSDACDSIAASINRHDVNLTNYSLPELKVQVSFSDRLLVVCLSVCFYTIHIIISPEPLG